MKIASEIVWSEKQREKQRKNEKADRNEAHQKIYQYMSNWSTRRGEGNKNSI